MAGPADRRLVFFATPGTNTDARSSKIKSGKRSVNYGPEFAAGKNRMGYRSGKWRNDCRRPEITKIDRLSGGFRDTLVRSGPHQAHTADSGNTE